MADFQEYPKWITDRNGQRRIVQNRLEEEAHKKAAPQPEPKPLKRNKKDKR